MGARMMSRIYSVEAFVHAGHGETEGQQGKQQQSRQRRPQFAQVGTAQHDAAYQA